MRILKALTIVSVLVVLIGENINVEAAEIDKYINIMQGEKYTIQYTDMTPHPPIHNRDIMDNHIVMGLFFYGTMNDSVTDIQPSKNRLVVDGKNNYKEKIINDKCGQCTLNKDDKTFDYVWELNSGKKKYHTLGHGDNHVYGYNRNVVVELMVGRDYGNSTLNRILNGIMPADYRSEAVKPYSFVTSGKLPDGISYEDYSKEENGVKEIVRFYFDKGSLIKLSSMLYWKDESGKWSTIKNKIIFDEFSSIVDASLLELPPTVKVDKKTGNATKAQLEQDIWSRKLSI